MSMELDHSFTVPVPPDRAWDVLLDVERIAPCMPGATVEEFDGEVVTGRIKVKVGPVALTYRGTAKFTERDPDARVVVVDASGKETRGAGTASAAVRATLEPDGDGTRVLIHTSMNVTGRPAQFGRGVIAEVGGKLIEKFAENLAQMISDWGVGTASPVNDDEDTIIVSVVGGGGQDVAAVAEQDVATAQDVAAEGETATGHANGDGDGAGGVTTTPATGPGSTQPVAVPPAAAVRPATSTVTAPAPAPAYNEDSINLVRLVGPAILKRVLPVALGAAVVALLGRRLLRRGKKS